MTAVARGAEKLRALEANVAEGLSTLQGDATDPAFVERLLRELKPDVVVLTAGVTPRMGRVDEFDWKSFSEAWNTDVKASFLHKASTHAAAFSGLERRCRFERRGHGRFALSGGYAGAKRMEWLLADYAQKVSNAKKLGIRFLAVLPRPIEGTTIGARAAAAYGAMSGITSEAFMKRVGVPLDKVASAILTALAGDVPAEVHAIAVTGAGIEPLT